MGRKEMIGLVLVVVIASVLVRFVISNPIVGTSANKIAAKLF